MSDKIVKAQRDREVSAFHMVILKTVIPLLFGVWCHAVHASNLRFNQYAPILQKIFSLPTFLLVDALLIWAVKADNDSRTNEINKMMATISGEGEDK